MLPPRPSAVAVATCAAASLAGPSRGVDEPASVQAAVELARHAALDARAALSEPGSRRTRRRLGRAVRRLAYSYTLTARLLIDHVPPAAAAGAFFIRAASEVAHDSAALAGRSDGHLQALAFRALRRTSRLQEDVALELSTGRTAGSIEDLIDALSVALRAQDALLATLDGALVRDRISPRCRHAIEARRRRASEARDELRAALAAARNAVQGPATADEGDEIAAPARPQNGPAYGAGSNERPDLP